MTAQKKAQTRADAVTAVRIKSLCMQAVVGPVRKVQVCALDSQNAHLLTCKKKKAPHFVVQKAFVELPSKPAFLQND